MSVSMFTLLFTLGCALLCSALVSFFVTNFVSLFVCDNHMYIFVSHSIFIHKTKYCGIKNEKIGICLRNSNKFIYLLIYCIFQKVVYVVKVHHAVVYYTILISFNFSLEKLLCLFDVF